MVVATADLPRRVYPVVFVVDTSGSMADDAKIDVLNQALQGAVARLASGADPEFDLHVAVIVYGDGAELVQPLAPARSVSLPRLEAGGRSNLGVALTRLCEVLTAQDFPETAHHPTIVLVSDGYPTDQYGPALKEARALRRFEAATRAAVRVGTDARDEHLADFCRGSLGVLDAADLMTMPEALLRITRTVESSASAASSSQYRRG